MTDLRPEKPNSFYLNKYHILLALILFSALGWYLYSKIITSKPPVQYQTASAERGVLVVSLSASGRISSADSRTVTTTASGVVKKVYVKEGQKVTTGTPLLEIDFDLNGRQKYQSAYSSYLSAQNSYKSAQDKLYSLESSYVSAKNIFDNQWSMQSPDDPTYIQKHNDLLTAKAALDQQQNVIHQTKTALESSRLSLQLSSSIVSAPISGIVSAISLSPGMILNPTSDSSNSSNIENKIAIVKTLTSPTVIVNLTEIDVPKVKVGNLVTLTLDAIPNQSFTGKIIAIDTSGTISSGVVNYPVTIKFDTENNSVFPNMSVTANVITDSKSDVIIIPSAALADQGGISTVQVMKNGSPQTVEVVTGLKSDSQIEIVSGISEGDEVITATINNSSSTTTTGQSSPFGAFGGQFRGNFGGNNRNSR